MGDENEAEPEFAHELGEQVEDLGLDGDVEGGDGFVGHDDARFEGEGASDGDALALAAGEFVRVFREAAGGDADEGGEFGDARGDVSGGAEAVNAQRLGEGFADAEAGIE